MQCSACTAGLPVPAKIRKNIIALEASCYTSIPVLYAMVTKNNGQSNFNEEFIM